MYLDIYFIDITETKIYAPTNIRWITQDSTKRVLFTVIN